MRQPFFLPQILRSMELPTSLAHNNHSMVMVIVVVVMMPTAMVVVYGCAYAEAVKRAMKVHSSSFFMQGKMPTTAACACVFSLLP